MNLSRTKPLVNNLLLTDVSLMAHGSSLPAAPGEEFADVFRKRYGGIDYEWGIIGASTDFVGFHSCFTLNPVVTALSKGNVTYRTLFSLIHLSDDSHR